MRTAPLMLLLFLLAGCLEPDDGDAGAPPAGTPAREAGPVSLETVGGGQQAQMREAGRFVFIDQEAFVTFWNATREDEQEAAPEVDFSRTTVVAALLGPKPNGCWAVRITNATDDGAGLTTVEATAYAPPPEQFCVSVVTYPWHVASMPGAHRQIVWEEREATFPPEE